MSRARTAPMLINGYRQRRRDSWSKRIASRFANAVRRRLLGDDTPDTGCGLKLFSRSLFLNLPFFDHMHRFLPALVLREGGVMWLMRHASRPHLLDEPTPERSTTSGSSPAAVPR